MPFTRRWTATATSPSMIMKGRTTPLPAPSARRATRKPPTRRMAARAPSSPNISAEMAEDYRIVFRANGGPEVLEVEKIEPVRSEEHTSELQSLMRISYAVFCLKKKKKQKYK